MFAPHGLGVFDAVADDLPAVPMVFAGAAVLVARGRVVVLAADVLLWTKSILHVRNHRFRPLPPVGATT